MSEQEAKAARIAYLETIIRNLLKANPLSCDNFLALCRCLHCGATVSDSEPENIVHHEDCAYRKAKEVVGDDVADIF